MGKKLQKSFLILALSGLLVSVFTYDSSTSFGSESRSTSPSTDQLPLWRASNASILGPERATNLHGIPVPSLTASQAIGTRGHVLLQDFFLIEKLASFNRERIPGCGARGYFQVTHDISQYTKAKFLNGIGKTTPVTVRFSTAVGERGTADTAVDSRGFAVKFYTEEGNYDLVGFNIEPFPTRTPNLFVDVNKSRKRNPVTNMNDQNMWFDFVSNRPESIANVLHLFSDIGRPDGYRRMDGFGVHAFKLVNLNGEVVFGKFVFKTWQPAPALTYQEAAELAGSNPEYNTQDLYDAIGRNEYPEWGFYMQVMTIEQAKNYPRNPFDITMPWRQEEYPLIPIGKMVLNKNLDNFFVDNELVAFAPSNMVPGIEPSPDRMLHARLFAYADTQRYRLGINHPQLPINRPLAPVNSYARDGLACYDDNGGGHPVYFPNSFGGHVADVEGARQVSFSVEGIVDRFDIPEPDQFWAARLFLERDVDREERRRLVESLVGRLRLARREIRERALNNLFYPVSKTFGDEVKTALLQALSKMEQEKV